MNTDYRKETLKQLVRIADALEKMAKPFPVNMTQVEKMLASGTIKPIVIETGMMGGTENTSR